VREGTFGDSLSVKIFGQNAPIATRSTPIDAKWPQHFRKMVIIRNPIYIKTVMAISNL
jgi:hypothetical protein